MRSHANGGSDLSVSFDAFKVTRWENSDGARTFTESTRWHVEALTPWARAMLADRRCFGIATANRAVVLSSPDPRHAGQMPSEQFGYGLGFERRKDALSFLSELEDAASGWWTPATAVTDAKPALIVTDAVGEAIAAILNYSIPSEQADYEREGEPEGHVFEHLRTLEEWARGNQPASDDDGDRSPELVWFVGVTETCTRLARFATHDAAAEYIGTLPGHETGMYYLDGPEC